jgi:hypothetical protein
VGIFFVARARQHSPALAPAINAVFSYCFRICPKRGCPGIRTRARCSLSPCAAQATSAARRRTHARQRGCRQDSQFTFIFAHYVYIRELCRWNFFAGSLRSLARARVCSRVPAIIGFAFARVRLRRPRRLRRLRVASQATRVHVRYVRICTCT